MFKGNANKDVISLKLSTGMTLGLKGPFQSSNKIIFKFCPNIVKIQFFFTHNQGEDLPGGKYFRLDGVLMSEWA